MVLQGLKEASEKTEKLKKQAVWAVRVHANKEEGAGKFLKIRKAHKRLLIRLQKNKLMLELDDI